MKEYKRESPKAKAKVENLQTLSLTAKLPLEDLAAGLREDVEQFAAQVGLMIIQAVMAQEVERTIGPWGQQKIHRHGRQAGYVVFSGRKVSVERPRLRNDQNQEVDLASYRAFQKEGKLQGAVSRQLTRQCSTRDYQGAIDDCLDGYGIERSSVSRHWKTATAQELEKLMQRTVPKDLLVLMIDGKFFGGDCIVTAIGVDEQGKKHVLGLWHGATENSTVVKGLLEDLVSRGLDCERNILVVLDGGKALRKAVQMVLGQNAVVQRCRIHKERNVLDQLPEEKQAQARWRLRGAWAQKDPEKAERELRKTARGLEDFAPMAASSLREGLEETLTVQKLGLGAKLGHSLSNTNLIESCFAHTAHWTRRVKRWDGPKMILRWTAAALLAGEKNFRRINGCEQLNQLQNVLHKADNNSTLKAA